MLQQRYKIGTVFLSRGKSKNLTTIIDVYKTYNSQNELIKLEYACEYEYMGQKMKSTINDAGISMALFQQYKEIPKEFLLEYN